MSAKSTEPHVRKLEEVQQRWQNLFDALNHDSDFICAIVSTSYLNDALGAMLEKFFVGTETKKRLLKPDSGLLGTLRAKADIAYCLRLIPKERCTAIIKAGEIRNAFAHSDTELEFKSDGIKKLCEELPWPHGQTVVCATPEHREKLDEMMFGTPRRKFVTVTQSLCIWTVMDSIRLQESQPYRPTETPALSPPSESPPGEG